MTQEETGYNGYSNYETWLLCLNIDNEEYLYTEINNIVDEQKGIMDTYDMGNMIKEYLEELFFNEEYNIYKICDTWTTRDWNEINWVEVAETRLEN
jgi:hypothetical protein